MGGDYDFGFRIYDSRIARWLSLDPKSIAGESPYVAMSNCPILNIDSYGEYAVVTTKLYGRNRNGDEIELKKFSFRKVTRKVIEVSIYNSKMVNISDGQVSPEVLQRAAELTQENIEKEFDGKVHTDPNNPQRSVSVKVTFVGGIQAVSDLSQVKMTGFQPDDLFLIVGVKTDHSNAALNNAGNGLIVLKPSDAHFYEAKVNVAGGELTLGIEKSENNVDLHEFIHRGGQKEHDGAVMSKNTKLRSNFNQKWNLFQGPWGNIQIKGSVDAEVKKQNRRLKK